MSKKPKEEAGKSANPVELTEMNPTPPPPPFLPSPPISPVSAVIIDVNQLPSVLGSDQTQHRLQRRMLVDAMAHAKEFSDQLMMGVVVGVPADASSSSKPKPLFYFKKDDDNKKDDKKKQGSVASSSSIYN